jgi:hypothetical protein
VTRAEIRRFAARHARVAVVSGLTTSIVIYILLWIWVLASVIVYFQMADTDGGALALAVAIAFSAIFFVVVVGGSIWASERVVRTVVHSEVATPRQARVASRGAVVGGILALFICRGMSVKFAFTLYLLVGPALAIGGALLGLWVTAAPEGAARPPEGSASIRDVVQQGNEADEG